MRALTPVHCPTPSMFWTRTKVPTCPSHLPATMPSCLETFESETFHLREGLWGVQATMAVRGFRCLLYMESLFCNKQLELIWPFVCLWGYSRIPVLTSCGPKLWLSLSDNHSRPCLVLEKPCRLVFMSFAFTLLSLEL